MKDHLAAAGAAADCSPVARTALAPVVDTLHPVEALVAAEAVAGIPVGAQQGMEVVIRLAPAIGATREAFQSRWRK